MTGSDDVCSCGHTRYIHSKEYGCEASQYAPVFCPCQGFGRVVAEKHQRKENRNVDHV